MKDFKLGDNVFRSVNPQWTVDQVCSLPCTIAAIFTKESFNFDDEVVREVIEYEVCYGTFDKDSIVKASSIFETEQQANEAGRVMLEAAIEKAATSYKKLTNNLRLITEL